MGPAEPAPRGDLGFANAAILGKEEKLGIPSKQGQPVDGGSDDAVEAESRAGLGGGVRASARRPVPPRRPAGAVLGVGAGPAGGRRHRRCGTGAATARIINGIDGAVAALGDNAYPSGSPSDYARCYDKT